MSRSTIAILSVLGISGLCSACLPAVNHGPQVEPGWNGGLSGAFSVGPEYSSGDYGAMPYFFGPTGFNLAHGWRSTEADRGALLLGLHVPLALALFPRGVFELAQADAYYQLPQRYTGSLDAGLGVNLAASHAMPYLQLGEIDANDSGWYMTHGLAKVWPGELSFRPALGWVPTLAYQIGRPRVTYHAFVTGFLGRESYDSCSQCLDRARYQMSAGVTFQFHRRR